MEILHDGRRRLRVRLPEIPDPQALTAHLERLPGVEWVRVVVPIRSVAIGHDGAAATREALVHALGPAPAKVAPVAVRAGGRRGGADHGARQAGAADEVRAPRGAALPRSRAGRTGLADVALPAVGLAALPWLPLRGQQAVSLSLVALRALQGWRQGRDPAGLVVETLSLAGTALTGNSIAAGTSVLMGSLAQRWRDGLVARNEHLLETLTPQASTDYPVRRGRTALRLAPSELRPGDVVGVGEGEVLPVDGFFLGGDAVLEAESHHEPLVRRPLEPGDWLAASRRVGTGALRYSAARTTERSRAEQLRRHVRHALESRDPPGGLTPDFHRLLALPVTTAGVVLALTRDAGRSAAMLQADPQEALALAHPLTREAALYLLAREGVLMSGMEPIERLAACRAIAFQDVGVLAGDRWRVTDVRACLGACDAAQATRLLARLAGRPARAQRGGFHDDQVCDWHRHGMVGDWRGRPVFVAGGAVLARAWGIELPESPAPSGLTRRLGVVSQRGLEAVITLTIELHPDAAKTIAALRGAGFERVAILTEDLGSMPDPALLALGADVVLWEGRRPQAAWLEEAARAGLHPALVHRGLRELLPPGGLSLCPVDAEAGAHGVLLGDALASLLAGRRAATVVRRHLAVDFAGAIVVNGGLILASATRLLPPLATALLHHAFALALLRRSDSLGHTGVET